MRLVVVGDWAEAALAHSAFAPALRYRPAACGSPPLRGSLGVLHIATRRATAVELRRPKGRLTQPTIAVIPAKAEIERCAHEHRYAGVTKCSFQ